MWPLKSKHSPLLKSWIGLFIFFFFATIFSYFYLDEKIAYYFQYPKGVTVSVSQLINILADPHPNVLLWPIVFYVAYFLLKKTSLGMKCLLIALSVNSANLLVVVLKMVFGRLRPELLFSEHLYSFHFFAFSKHFNFSFPSGHAATIAAIFFSLSCFYPKQLFLWALVSLFLSLSRVITVAHYLSDVTFGICVGMAVSALIYRSMKENSLKSIF